MPSLSQHQSNDYTKLLIMGDSGSGKTGALASLVAADYKLRVLDYDNGLEVLKQYILKECPDKIDNVEFRTFRDKRRSSPEGSVIDGIPKAFSDGIKMLDRWRYKLKDGTEVDYGVPSSWGPDTILVLDSLTFFSIAAYDFREPLVPRSRDGKYDQRAVYGDAQDAVENILAFINAESFQTNVIVISHVKYMEREDGKRKGYPTTIGSALSPNVPTYFNTLALCETREGGRRTIQTAATEMIDLKNPKPFEMQKSYPIGTGLAEIFGVLRAPPQKQVLKQAARRA